MLHNVAGNVPTQSSKRNRLNGDPFHFVQRNLLLPPVVELGGPWGLVVGDVLGRLERAAVLQVGGDAGGAEGMVADPGLDAGGLRPPLDHAVGVLLPQSVAGEPARSARRGLEQGRVRVLRDAGRGDIFVQIPLQVVVAGNFMLLAPAPSPGAPARRSRGLSSSARR